MENLFWHLLDLSRMKNKESKIRDRISRGIRDLFIISCSAQISTLFHIIWSLSFLSSLFTYPKKCVITEKWDSYDEDLIRNCCFSFIEKIIKNNGSHFIVTLWWDTEAFIELLNSRLSKGQTWIMPIIGQHYFSPYKFANIRKILSADSVENSKVVL